MKKTIKAIVAGGLCLLLLQSVQALRHSWLEQFKATRDAYMNNQSDTNFRAFQNAANQVMKGTNKEVARNWKNMVANTLQGLVDQDDARTIRALDDGTFEGFGSPIVRGKKSQTKPSEEGEELPPADQKNDKGFQLGERSGSLSRDAAYATLGLSKGASVEQITKAYRELARKHHPDKGGDINKFQEINDAYQTLLTGDSQIQPKEPLLIENGEEQILRQIETFLKEVEASGPLGGKSYEQLISMYTKIGEYGNNPTVPQQLKEALSKWKIIVKTDIEHKLRPDLQQFKDSVRTITVESWFGNKLTVNSASYKEVEALWKKGKELRAIAQSVINPIDPTNVDNKELEDNFSQLDGNYNKFLQVLADYIYSSSPAAEKNSPAKVLQGQIEAHILRYKTAKEKNVLDTLELKDIDKWLSSIKTLLESLKEYGQGIPNKLVADFTELFTTLGNLKTKKESEALPFPPLSEEKEKQKPTSEPEKEKPALRTKEELEAAIQLVNKEADEILKKGVKKPLAELNDLRDRMIALQNEYVKVVSPSQQSKHYTALFLNIGELGNRIAKLEKAPAKPAEPERTKANLEAEIKHLNKNYLLEANTESLVDLQKLLGKLQDLKKEYESVVPAKDRSEEYKELNINLGMLEVKIKAVREKLAQPEKPAAEDKYSKMTIEQIENEEIKKLNDAIFIQGKGQVSPEVCDRARKLYARYQELNGKDVQTMDNFEDILGECIA